MDHHGRSSTSQVSSSAVDEALWTSTMPGLHVCFSYLIQRSGAGVCYSPATAWQNNFLFTKGNSPMSWADGDSHVWRFDFSNSYIMPVIVKSIKKSRHTPQSKAKKVWQPAFQPCLSRDTAIIGGGRIMSNSNLTTILLSFLKGYIRKP